MQQFGVYRNRNAATRSAWPLLLNVQSDLISETGTRIVAPLVPAGGPMPSVPALAPRLTVGGSEHVMVTPLLAAVELADLGAIEGDLSDQRSVILAALDFVFSGI